MYVGIESKTSALYHLQPIAIMRSGNVNIQADIQGRYIACIDIRIFQRSFQRERVFRVQIELHFHRVILHYSGTMPKAEQEPKKYRPSDDELTLAWSVSFRISWFDFRYTIYYNRVTWNSKLHWDILPRQRWVQRKREAGKRKELRRRKRYVSFLLLLLLGFSLRLIHFHDHHYDIQRQEEPEVKEVSGKWMMIV